MTGNDNSKKISLKGEILRKLTHLGAFVVPGFYYYTEIPRLYAFSALFTALVIMVMIDIGRMRGWKIWNITGKFIAPMLRQSEMEGHDFSGATYILMAMCMMVSLYPKEVVLISLSFIIFGDPASAIFGRRFGKHKFKNKSLEGSLAFLFFAVIVAFLAPEIYLPIALIGAVVATVTEALSFNVDDNVTVPLMSGLTITILTRIFISQ